MFTAAEFAHTVTVVFIIGFALGWIVRYLSVDDKDTP